MIYKTKGKTLPGEDKEHTLINAQGHGLSVLLLQGIIQVFCFQPVGGLGGAERAGPVRGARRTVLRDPRHARRDAAVSGIQLSSRCSQR